jgi:TMEM175 potassium channel family protein
VAEHHPHARLEAFCDGVFAIAITLLVIDLKVPSAEEVHSTADLWRALGHLAPSVFAFLLSFGTILITWVNHHAVLKLLDKSSHAFIFANGFLLLTVAIVPFPTALLGEYLFTAYAGPAMAVYAAVYGLQALAWVLVAGASLYGTPVPLTRSDAASTSMQQNTKRGVLALFVYAGMSVAAVWFPLAVAGVMTLMWIGWLIAGVRMRG